MELVDLKEKIINVAENINEDTTIDDVMERIYFIYKVETGIRQANEGKTITHSELKRQVRQWGI